MCTYSQLKKIQKKIICATPPGGQWRPLCPKIVLVYSGKDTSKCIDGGSMKLATLVDYVYM